MLKQIMIFAMVTMVLLGCSKQTTETADSIQIAKAFLDEQGYTILSHEHTEEPDILTEKQLRETYYMTIWQVQSVSPDQYLGKNVGGEIFIVKNHPLDHYEHSDAKSLGKTRVHVLIAEGEVIGGTSFPVVNAALYGSLFSLDGRTFEELHPDVNWRAWADEWFEKYSDKIDP